MIGRSVDRATALKYAMVSLSSVLYRIGGNNIKPSAPHFFAFAACCIASFVVLSAIFMITGISSFRYSTENSISSSFSFSVIVLASPKEPPMITPLTPASFCAARFFSNISRSSSSFLLKGVSSAGKTPFHSNDI